MKNYRIHFILISLITISLALANCKKDEGTTPPPTEDTYILEDQAGRPAISIVLVSAARKNEFNTTIPSELADTFADDFAARILELNPNYAGNGVTGQSIFDLSETLATDVLNVDTSSASAYIALNGRTLGDDVIDNSLLILFGGPGANENPGLTRDNVDGNDKVSLQLFPYLANPH